MDSFSYTSLESEYGQFYGPIASIEVDGNDIRDAGVALSDVEVDLTSGFEAGVASFSMYDCYDLIETTFEYDKIKKFIILGSQVNIYLGYATKVREVFRGVITRVEFVVDDSEPPHVRVTAMDVKGIMMANRYHKRMLSANYSSAIKEIFAQPVYMELQGPSGVISKLEIGDTPDVAEALLGTGASSETIEMVGESDYEFVVRCARKFNFEFFCVGGQVLFREAKADTSTLVTFSNDTKIFNMNVGYDISGLVGSLTVRGVNPGKAQTFESTMKHSFKISSKSKAKKMIKESSFTSLDPTVFSKSDAQRKAWYLFDEMSYRFGSLDIEIMGLPEVIPGRFVEIADFGTAVSNIFYVTEVKHILAPSGRYTTRIIGKAKELQTDLMSMI